MQRMGTPGRKKRQKPMLRERILDAARRIVMREGLAALSMRRIADAIGYSPATLYLHFESRAGIARALRVESYAQLLDQLAPFASIDDPVVRLKAFGSAYVGFGVAHPEAYQLMFMQDLAYAGAAPVADSAGEPQADAGDAVFRLMAGSFDQLKEAGWLPASAVGAVWAEALWATMHGIVALRLTCPALSRTPPDALVDLALDAWLSTQSGVERHLGERSGTRPKAARKRDVETGVKADPKAAQADPAPPKRTRARRAAPKPETPVA
jgi:AcrR family transcriptional regulator